MRGADFLRFAGFQLRQNKGRTALTATGVTVGVFALTTIVALGGGLEEAVVAQLTDDESQTRVAVSPGFGAMPDEVDAAVEGIEDPAKADRIRKAITKRRRGGPGGMRRTLLTPDEVAAIESRDHVAAVRPFVVDRFKLTLGDDVLDGAISYGVAPGDARWDERVIAGRPFEDTRAGLWLHEYTLYRWGYRTDAQQAALVGETVLLARPRESSSLATLLDVARDRGVDVPEGVDAERAEALLRAFAGDMGVEGPPAAPELALEMEVLGVVRERVEADGFEVWEDSFSMQADVFLPQPLAEELFLQVPSNLTRGFHTVAVEVDAVEHVREVEQAIRDEGYRTVSIGTILERVGQALAVLTVFVSGLTAVALLVAVLGIVNTMVMNVSERTREIGVLKALGATDGQVRGLFVCEAGLIGLIGGLLGVALSLLASIPGDWAARWAIKQSTEYGFDGTVFSFAPWLLAAAAAFAVALSVAAAWAPASRGARVDPVEALREE